MWLLVVTTLRDTVKKLIDQELKLFLGEELIYFVCEETRDAIAKTISCAVDPQKPSAWNAPKLPFNKSICGIVSDSYLFLQVRTNLFLWPIFPNAYVYEASITNIGHKSQITGKYKMFGFARIFFLIWINLVFFGMVSSFIWVTIDIV